MENKSKIERLFELQQEQMDALNVSVQIDFREISKVVIRDLVHKRNSHNCDMVAEFDAILKSYYLSDEEFDKYVVRGESID